MPYVVSSDCILCGACVSGCEVGAITEGEEQCHIDPDVCIECGDQPDAVTTTEGDTIDLLEYDGVEDTDELLDTDEPEPNEGEK